jgi:putative spermidine/putrescine transport system substrate-binding protein
MEDGTMHTLMRPIASLTRALRTAAGAALVVSCAAALLAGCGGGDSSASEAASTTSETAPATTESAGTAASLPSLDGTTLTFLFFGGPVEEGLRKAWTDPFTEATGAKFVYDSPTDYAKLKTQVESKNVTYDVVNADPYEVDANCGTLWEHIENVDLSDVLPQFKPTTDCGVPDYMFAYQISYAKKAFPDGGPRDCVDFFDTKKYPGKRGLWSYFFNGAIECAAIAAGADPAHVYPLDLDKAYAKLNEIKDDVVIFDSTAEAGDMMQNEDLDMILFSNRATAQVVHEGAPFESSFDWAIRAVGYFAIPKGAPNKEAAETFLNYILDKDVNRRISNVIAYGSATGGPLGPDLAAYYKPYDPVEGPLADHATDIDWSWWTENLDVITKRWTAYSTS